MKHHTLLHDDNMESLWSVFILAEVQSVCNQFHRMGKLLLHIMCYMHDSVTAVAGCIFFVLFCAVYSFAFSVLRLLVWHKGMHVASKMYMYHCSSL